MIKKVVSLVLVLFVVLSFNMPIQAAHVHKYSSATCNAPQRCSCGATIGNGLGHSFTGGNCTTKSTCSRCGATGSLGSSHNFSGGTCSTRSKCSRCGAAGSYGSTHNYSSATCTAPQRCSCGSTIGNGLGHNFTGGTCSTKSKCSRCGVAGSYGTTHNYSSATCTAPQRCSCGLTIGNGLGHNFAGGTCTTPSKCLRCNAAGSISGHNMSSPTCTQPGKCSKCSLIGPSALGHSFSGGTCTVGAKCSRCSTTLSAPGHSYSSATCISPQRCFCGATIGNGLGHNFTGGNCSTKSTCTRCGAAGSYGTTHNYSSATCTAPQRCACGVTIGNGLGHSFAGGTCTTPSKCLRCSATGSISGHNMSSPTCTQPGKCSTCSLIGPNALGHSFSGETCTIGAKCIKCSTTLNAPGHNYVNATCTSPQRCTTCNSTIGNGLGHTFDATKANCQTAAPCSRQGCTATGEKYSSMHEKMLPATCNIPQRCAANCGYTVGNGLGHAFDATKASCSIKAPCSRLGCTALGEYNSQKHVNMLPATCGVPKRCAEDCGYTEGNCLPHFFTGGTCTEASVCKCGTLGAKKPHDFTYKLGSCSTKSQCECGELGPLNNSIHTYKARCTSPDRCDCGATIGNEPKGHIYDRAATCKSQTPCKRNGCNEIIPIEGHVFFGNCNETAKCLYCTEYGKLPHDFTYKLGSCSTKSECKCGEKGTYNYSVHNFKERCTSPDRCDCGATIGNEPKGHIYDRAATCKSQTPCKRDGCNEIIPIEGHVFFGNCNETVKCLHCTEYGKLSHDYVTKGDWTTLSTRAACQIRTNRCKCSAIDVEYDLTHDKGQDKRCTTCYYCGPDSIQFPAQNEDAAVVVSLDEENRIINLKVKVYFDSDTSPELDNVYKEEIEKGISKWEGPVDFDGLKYNIKINIVYLDNLTKESKIDDVSGKETFTCKGGVYFHVKETKEIWTHAQLGNWSANQGVYIEYGIYRYAREFMPMIVAHEFGHVLGLHDAYDNFIEDNKFVDDAKILGVDDNDLMWGGYRKETLKVTNLNRCMFIEAFLNNQMYDYDGINISSFIPKNY